MMQESTIFDQYDFYRERTIEAIDFMTEDQADVIPSGFNNSMRWNLGHILVSQEQLMYYFGMNQPGEVSKQTVEAFRRGTSPHDWSDAPLSLSEIQMQLQEQKERMKTVFPGKLAQPAAKIFDLGKQRELKTLGDLFVFSLWHEGFHQGISRSIKRSIKNSLK
jgi:hypothetical protein